MKGSEKVQLHKNSKNIKFLTVIIFSTLIFLIIFFMFNNRKTWVIEEISFNTRDNFELKAFLLKPVRTGNKKYPVVACFHQLSGNRDDFLKLFPLFAERGIVAIAPNFIRQRANLSTKRITDLKDTIEFLDTLKFVDKRKKGIITASFTVETGMYAIVNDPDVIANVIMSGPILRENSRKWITRNTNLAIFNIASIIDGNHYLLMQEYIARSLNPLSRNHFITNTKAPFTLPAHGTFIFDEIPEIMSEISDFYSEVFGITKNEKGVIKNPVPENMVTFYSTDNMPINATFKKPSGKTGIPGLIVYPPESETRKYFDEMINILVKKGFAVLAPNTKRACRKKTKINLCNMEVNGALNFMKNDPNIDPDKIAVLLPAFYHLFAIKSINENSLDVGLIILMNFKKFKSDLDLEKIRTENGPTVKFIRGLDQHKIYIYLKKYL